MKSSQVGGLQAFCQTAKWFCKNKLNRLFQAIRTTNTKNVSDLNSIEMNRSILDHNLVHFVRRYGSNNRSHIPYSAGDLHWSERGVLTGTAWIVVADSYTILDFQIPKHQTNTGC